MKILFLDTSSFFVTISVLNDDKILFLYQDEIHDDMSSKIVPIISNAFSSLNMSLDMIDKIMVVNGPGSFTGVRIGVTIAKVLAWSLKKDVIPVSSLAYLATTKVETKYIIPMIDARRGYVYAGLYDQELNNIVPDNYMEYNHLKDYFSEATIVSLNDLDDAIKPHYDICKIVLKHCEDQPVLAHKLVPNYLKRTEAEENLKNKCNVSESC